MLVDWFTIGAQVVNFVVLVAILRYFLYGRIIRTVEARREDIKSRLEKAEQREAETKRAAAEQEERETEWEQERDKRLAGAKEEAEEKKKELVDEARREVEELRRRWHEALENDRSSFLQDLQKGIGKRAHDMARQTLLDIADEELERHVLRVFRNRLRDMDRERRSELRDAVEGSTSGVTIVSAFEILESDRNELGDDVRETLGRALEIKFETAPDVICGIELLTDGHEVGFSIGSRMQKLEEWIDHAIGDETRERSDV